MKLIYVPAVCLLVLIFACPSVTLAYQYNGAAWCCSNGNEISYCVDREDIDWGQMHIQSDPYYVPYIESAAEKWNALNNAFQLVYAGLTDYKACIPDNQTGNCIGRMDGQNGITVQKSCDFPQGYYAISYWWTQGCCIIEADICLNNAIKWSRGVGQAECVNAGDDYIDYESAILHQLGYWISLGDEEHDEILGYEPVMYPYLDYCEMRRNLTEDDSAGLYYAYQPGAGGMVLGVNDICDSFHKHPPYWSYATYEGLFLECEWIGCGDCVHQGVSCEYTEVDPCLVVCPGNDITYTIRVRDNCNDPMLDYSRTYLDFSNCPAEACPDEELYWPKVYCESYDGVTGEHHFRVASRLTECTECDVDIYVGNQLCTTVPVHFLDVNGDYCVASNDWVNDHCNDYNCNGAMDSNDWDLLNSHIDHCCQNVPSPGDADGNGEIDDMDVVFINSYLYEGGAPPDPMSLGDPNGDCWIDYQDIEYLIDYLEHGGPAPVAVTCDNPQPCQCRPGEANGDGGINVGDAVYIVNAVFKGGPLPTPYSLCSGDANCDCSFNIGDGVYIINRVFHDGPATCSCIEWIDMCGSPLRE
jgi:hypothetical protein